ncbi:hypothetical protein BT08F33_36900 [Escherichia coli]
MSATQLAEKVSLSETIAAFRDAMMEQGIETRDEIVADGTLHRIHVHGDSRGTLNGWYILHYDERPAGQFGCNKRYGFDKKFNWQSNCKTEPLTAVERKAYAERVARERAEKDAAEKARHEAAAAAANKLWDASAEASDDHPYLKSKGVKAHGLRVGKWEKVNKATGEVRLITDNALLVPICDRTRKIHSLQAIFPAKMKAMGDRNKDYQADGAKRGLFHRIGNPQLHDGKHVFILCEGYATGASIHECTGHTVLVCFDAGNLPVVAQSIHEFMKGLGKDAIIILAADNDRWTSTPVANPGVYHAREAVKSVGGLLAVPDFEDLEGKPTDFNDLHQREGAEAVRAAFELALNPPEPDLVDTPEPEQEPTQNPANDNAASQSDDDAEVPEHIRAIREINKNHALALTGDKALILRETIGERFGKELQYLSVATLRTWLLNRTVPMEVIGKGGQAAIKHVPVAELWLKSAERRQYEGVTFAPANNAPDCYYNLWSGFAYEPLDCGIFNAGMKCRRLLKHMKYILCGGNSAHFRYLLAWAADMLQDPDNKKGVALVMRGLKGTGKSTFAEALASLLGRHSIKIAHMRHLTGNFNRHLADKLLVLAEESYWAGDKADEGPLKDMITSDRMTIEAKGVDAVEMPSLCRLIMITNNEWAAPATADERRYFVLDVSDRRRQDYGYFDRLYGQLEGNDSEGYRALLSLLLQFPLKSVNLRQVPETTALRQQRALSLEPHDQFIYDALIDGTLAGKDWDGFLNVGKDELYDRYIESSRKRGKTHLLTKALFGKKFMAATAATTARIRDGYERLQVYRILPREETAIHFSQHCGVDVFIDGEYNERPI